MKLLEGKNALVLGLANEKSIAWGIIKAFKEQGANIGLNYLNEHLKKRVEPLAEEVGADFCVELDVTNDEHMDSLANTVKSKWDKVDIIVHSLAFADKNDLSGRFVDTSRKGFSLAMDISAYSLVGVCQRLEPLFSDDSSVIAMTYHGSTKVVENYNVMGVAKAALEANIRYLADDLGPKGVKVNAISAGPIRTLASAGISGFRSILKVVEERAPLRKNVTPEDVAGTALYLGSGLSSGVTGQVIYVDSGYSILSL